MGCSTLCTKHGPPLLLVGTVSPLLHNLASLQISAVNSVTPLPILLLLQSSSVLLLEESQQGISFGIPPLSFLSAQHATPHRGKKGSLGPFMLIFHPLTNLMAPKGISSEKRKSPRSSHKPRAGPPPWCRWVG